ncbi:hypothetical protein [Burkholderia pseudomallei]|uniref:hypothetical protein n=1 Tax=Burkholderia pseudomallei TaxID=28450 RepID=UPI001E547025|nr:hypothetical protein [Burkholderia pseudomallei]
MARLLRLRADALIARIRADRAAELWRARGSVRPGSSVSTSNDAKRKKMNAFNIPGDSPVINVSTDEVFGFRLPALWAILAITIALLATAVSLGIAAYAGGLRGGTAVQRTMIAALACVAVLYVHLIPMCWCAFSVSARVAGGVLWIVGIVVVMVGQVTFFVESQRDAGNQRAASVPVVEAPNSVDVPQHRGLAEIAGDRVQVVADLARIEARRCMGLCLSVAVSKAKLNAQLAALDAETAEAKRREAEEDRAVAQVERDDALRASLRADLVASQIASLIGTTESRLELMQDVAFAVVLEGAAVMGWLLVARVWPRVRVAPEVATGLAMVSDDPASQKTASAVVAGGISLSTRSEDDRVLDQIHAEVVAGRLRPTQAAIREFLGRGQATAGRFARLYRSRFNNGSE